MTGVGLILLVVPLYMKLELDLNIFQIGLITAIFPICRIFGSLFFGFLSDKWGRKILLYICLICSIFITPLLIFAVNWMFLSITYGVIGFVFGGYMTVNFAMFMDVTNPKVGGSQFSIFTSLSNTGELGTSTVSGSMVSVLGFTKVFLYAGVLFGPVLLILYLIKNKK